MQIRKEYKFLGVITADPSRYVQSFGDSLRAASDLPDFVNEFKTPEGLTLAAHHQASDVHELEGDVHALNLVDLDQQGNDPLNFLENHF